MSEAPLPVTDAPTASEHGEAYVCPNCGHENRTPVCGRCGQKRIHDGDLSLRHAWHHLVHELFHVDGKILNSLKLLFTRPGQLTLDFLEGRRARHVHPIRLFLVIGAAFFLFARVNSPVDMHVAFNRQTTDKHDKLEAYLKERGFTADQFASESNRRVAAAFKPIYIAAILAQGLWLWLMFRKKRPYLAENMVMTLHLASFNMAVWVVVGSLFLAGVNRGTTSAIALILGFAYFLFAARRVYGGNWLGLTFRWLAMLFLTMVVMWLVFMTLILLLLFGH